MTGNWDSEDSTLFGYCSCCYIKYHFFFFTFIFLQESDPVRKASMNVENDEHNRKRMKRKRKRSDPETPILVCFSCIKHVFVVNTMTWNTSHNLAPPNIYSVMLSNLKHNTIFIITHYNSCL